MKTPMRRGFTLIELLVVIAGKKKEELEKTKVGKREKS